MLFSAFRGVKGREEKFREKRKGARTMTVAQALRKANVWTPAKIKSLRERLGNMTQQELARVLQVTISRVENWEQGRQSPKGPAKIVLNLLDTHPELLLEAAGSPG